MALPSLLKLSSSLLILYSTIDAVISVLKHQLTAEITPATVYIQLNYGYSIVNGFKPRLKSIISGG